MKIGMRAIALSIAIWMGFACVVSEAATLASTAIVLQGYATYDDATNTYQTTSNEVTINVAQVALAQISTTQASCSSAASAVAFGSKAVDDFTVTNNGNAPDTFVVKSADLAGGGTIESISYIDSAGTAHPVGVNGSGFPALAVGQSIVLRAIIDTSTLSIGSQVTLAVALTDQINSTTIRSAATACTTIVKGAKITQIGGGSKPLALNINGSPSIQLLPGKTANVGVSFVNSGAITAQQVTLSNTLPAGFSYVPGSVKINGVTLTSGFVIDGNTIHITIPQVLPNDPMTVSFDANLSPDLPRGTTLYDNATISGTNSASVILQPAAIFIGVADVVFDALSRTASPVTGAVIQLLDDRRKPYALPKSGVFPNAENVNPYTTGSDGTYSFTLPDVTSPTQYEVDISAPRYSNRRLNLSLKPGKGKGTYDATLTALDGSPLAEAGSLTLTTLLTKQQIRTTLSDAHRSVHLQAETSSLSSVSSFFGNIPMFLQVPISLSVGFDRTAASIGDKVVITIQTDPSVTTYNSATIRSMLPYGLGYATGTGRFDGYPFEPNIIGNTQVWNNIDASVAHTITFIAVVVPQVRDSVQVIETAYIDGYTLASKLPLTASATADLTVIPGIFSQRVILLGRVAQNNACSALFARAVGIPNVRLYLENGEYVVTDDDGRYSFPTIAPVSHVITIDRQTLPSGVRACYRPGREKALQRLVHGVMDTDTMQEENFLFESAP